MKKLKRIIFLVFGTLALTVVTVICVKFFPVVYMKPTATGKFNDTEILAIKNNSNSVCFININDEYLMVDGGSSLKTIETAIKKEKISPSKVKYILLTHSDNDHVAAIKLFSNAKTYMSEDEIQMINGETKRPWNKSNSLPDGITQDSINSLKDEQLITIGNHSIECIKVSGHTPGSMAFILDG